MAARGAGGWRCSWWEAPGLEEEEEEEEAQLSSGSRHLRSGWAEEGKILEGVCSDVGWDRPEVALAEGFSTRLRLIPATPGHRQLLGDRNAGERQGVVCVGRPGPAEVVHP